MKTKKDRSAYSKFIAAQASFAMGSTAFIALVLVLACIDVFDYFMIGSTQWKHIPTFAFIIFGYIVSVNFNSPTWQKIASYWFDLICLSVIASSTYLTIVCSKIDGFILDSAPLQISLFITCMFGFHLPKKVFIRNIAFGVLCSIGLYLDSSTLFVRSIAQILVGCGVGTSMYFVLFEVLLRAKHTISVSLNQKSETLRSVLESSKYPHQKKMIEDGFKEEETLPTGSYHDAIIIKLDVIASSTISDPKYQEAFNNFCLQLEGNLLSDYALVSISPLKLTGRGFFIKKVGDAALVSIGYPFFVKDGDSIADSTMAVIEVMAKLFNDNMQVLNHDSRPSFCMGIVFEQVSGEISGTRKNYDLTGRGMNLVERYETLRKQFIDIEVEVPKESFLIIQNKAKNIIFNNSHFNLQQVIYSNIRDDSSAKSFWIGTLGKSYENSLKIKKGA